MEKLIKKTGKESMFISLCLIILSIILITNPSDVAKIITYMAAGIVIFIGISRIISSYKIEHSFTFKNFDITSGLALIIAGILILIFSGTVFAIIRIALGIWTIYNGLLRLITSFKLKQIYATNWIAYLVIALLLIIGGIYLVFTTNAFIRIAGIVLLISSVLDIIGAFIFNTYVDELFN